MAYLGIHRQIQRNNRYSLLLLLAFPLLLLALLFTILYFSGQSSGLADTWQQMLPWLPFVLAGVAIWFLIAWWGHGLMIRLATGSKPLQRQEHMRIYNLLENLCIAQGMPMPKLYIIHDDSLNAFASGLQASSYSISVSSGLIDQLTDAELEGVLAHELAHIRHRDVRLLVISIIFVGIFAFLAEVAFRSLRFAGSGRRSKDSKGSGAIILIAIVATAIAYLLSMLLRFGISRRREYLADAAAADMTRKPMALASALRKIAGDPLIEAVENRDIAQLFIENPKPSAHRSASWDNLFATHPPIQKRISILEQFT